MYQLLFIISILMVSCTSKTSVSKQQSSEANHSVKRTGYSFSAMAFEVDNREMQQTGEKVFKVSLDVEKGFLESQPALSKALQYKMDSAFYAIAGNDTIQPLYVMPVANGQPLRPQYLVAFEWEALKKYKQVALHTHLNEQDQSNDQGLRIELSK